MCKQSLKKGALLLTFWLALHTEPVHATTILAGTSPAIIEMDANGLLDDIGTYGTGTLSLSGAGTRMIWYPGKAAFRAGSISGTQWDDAHVGPYSAAFGGNTTASGYASTALGVNTIAIGLGAIAVGDYSSASGYTSAALGYNSQAGGDFSMAFGLNSTASAYAATAMGHQTTASGNNSTALGEGTTASGYFTTASGYNTTAQAYADFVVGTWNVGGGSTTTWVSSDPLFEIGNGPDVAHPSDALLVDKSGNMTVKATISVGTAGDGLQVKEGSNAKQGTATLTTGGTVTVSNSNVTANSRIILTGNADGGTPGWLRVSGRTAGTSFTITSSNTADRSTVAYEIFEPAP